jgi:hypothetical protein
LERKRWIGNQTVADLLEECGYWALFSVLIALAQLWLIPFAYYAYQRPWTLVDLVGNGSLLFFTTTITSKTAGDYFRKVRVRSKGLTLFCIAITFGIVLLSVFLYAIVVAAPRIGITAGNSLRPDRVARLSEVLAISGLLFSFVFTLIIRVSQE